MQYKYCTKILLLKMEKDIKDFTRKLRLVDFFLHLTFLWLKTNPTSVLFKTVTVLWNP